MNSLKIMPNFNRVNLKNNAQKVSFKEKSDYVVTTSSIEDSFTKEKDNKKRNILIKSGIGIALLIGVYFAGRKGVLGKTIKDFFTRAKNKGGSVVNPQSGSNVGTSTAEEINSGIEKLIKKRKDGTLLRQVEKNEKGDITKIHYYDKSGKNVKETIEVLSKDRFSSTNHANNTVTILTKNYQGSEDGRQLEVLKDNNMVKCIDIYDGIKNVTIYDPKAPTNKKFKIIKRENIDLESGRKSLERLHYNLDGSYTMSRVGKDGSQSFKRFNQNGFLTSCLEKDNNGQFVRRTKYKYKMYIQDGIPRHIRLEKSVYKDAQGNICRIKQYMDKLEPLKYKYEQELFDVTPTSRDIVIYRKGNDFIEKAGKVTESSSVFTDTEGVTHSLRFDSNTGKKIDGAEHASDGTLIRTKTFHPVTQEMTYYIEKDGLKFRSQL